MTLLAHIGCDKCDAVLAIPPDALTSRFHRLGLLDRAGWVEWSYSRSEDTPIKDILQGAKVPLRQFFDKRNYRSYDRRRKYHWCKSCAAKERTK